MVNVGTTDGHELSVWILCQFVYHPNKPLQQAPTQRQYLEEKGQESQPTVSLWVPAGEGGALKQTNRHEPPN